MSDEIADDIWVDFGRWFREQRRSAELTQEEVAKRAGVTRQHLGDLEKGMTGVKRHTLIRLATAVGSDMGETLTRAGFSADTRPLRPLGDPLYVRIGKRLRERRDELGYTLEEMGTFLGITGVGYGQYERGQSAIPLTNLVKVAKRFRKSVEWFLVDEAGEIASDEADEQEVLAFYRGAPPRVKPVAKQVLMALIRDAEREDTTHGRKAE